MFKSGSTFKSATCLLKQTLALFLLVQMFVEGQDAFTLPLFLNGLYWNLWTNTQIRTNILLIWSLFASVSVTPSVVKYVWLL